MSWLPPHLPTIALLVVGLGLVAGPVVVPPDVPADRVEYYVEDDWTDYPDQETIAYSNMTSDGREVFDTAIRSRPDTVNLSVDESPTSLTPDPQGIDVYNVRYESAVYLLQVKHLTYEADFLTQTLPRLGALGVGVLLSVAAAYRHSR